MDLFRGQQARKTVPVLSTSMSMSDRFAKVGNNPLRPNPVVQRVVAAKKPFNFGGEDEEDFDLERGDFGVAVGANKLSVLRAAKDAEILKLKRQLENERRRKMGQGGGGMGGGHGGGGGFNAVQKNRGGMIVKNRLGGGMRAGQHGKGLLNLSRQAALGILHSQFASEEDGVSPLKRMGKGELQELKKDLDKLSKGRFFGAPKSRKALDAELDKYMSKAKSKQKTSLDAELDSYMAARKKNVGVEDLGAGPASPTSTIGDTSLDAELDAYMAARKKKFDITTTATATTATVEVQQASTSTAAAIGTETLFQESVLTKLTVLPVPSHFQYLKEEQEVKLPGTLSAETPDVEDLVIDEDVMDAMDTDDC